MIKLLLVAGAGLIAVGAVAFCVARSKGQPQLTFAGPISSWRIANSWSVGRGEFEGKPIFTRFNEGLAPLAGRPEFAKQIGVAVPLNDPTRDGLPQGAEFGQLNEIEDLLERRLTDQNKSLYAGAITTNAMREFVLYTSDADEAVLKIRELAQHVAHHKLQWVINDDPEWRVFKKYLGR